MAIITKVVGGAIGLGQEAIAHRRASQSTSLQPPAYDGIAGGTSDRDTRYQGDLDEDELEWDLDDAEDDEAPYQGKSYSQTRDIDQIFAEFDRHHPRIAAPTSHGPLPCPVILPQRRPQHKDRGFVRAYAPVLEDCDIDQATFFEFLSGFERAIKMHPAFHAVNVGVGAGAIAFQAVSGVRPIAAAVAFALHAGVETSRRGYIQHETNRYLDGMNERLFKPRGLYCMIMTYKPNSPDAMTTIKPSDTILDSVDKRSNGRGGKFSSSSGTTRTDLAIPYYAPLIFPLFDPPQNPNSERAAVNKTKGSTRAFLSDYFDRRSQAKFEYSNPDSRLNIQPSPSFASRYSDPNSPAMNGGLIGLLSGGHMSSRRSRRQQRRWGGLEHQKQPRGPKRFLKQDVLYLMIVNMPCEEELRQARKQRGLK